MSSQDRRVVIIADASGIGFASASAQAPAPVGAPAAAARPAEPGTGPAAGFSPLSVARPVTGS